MTSQRIVKRRSSASYQLFLVANAHGARSFCEKEFPSLRVPWYLFTPCFYKGWEEGLTTCKGFLYYT
jgi:hypothetical protein